MTKENQLIDFVLFTRIKRGDDLIQVGSFKAVSTELAEVYAQHIYDEEDWVEMQIAPKDAMICIRKPEPLFK